MAESTQPPIDLAFIGSTLQRLVTEVASLRDGVDVLAAIVRRLDNNQGRMLDGSPLIRGLLLETEFGQDQRGDMPR